MDRLVILGNFTEFRRVVKLITVHYAEETYMMEANTDDSCSQTSSKAARIETIGFNLDVNVSVFETTIRILGGLLSAHLLAIDPMLGIYVSGIF